jgi:hypothetical protein
VGAKRRNCYFDDPRSLVNFRTVYRALNQYTNALACQPWLDQFPLSLQGVIPQKYNQGWALRDGDNHLLRLTPKFTENWQLFALSGGHPITVFGEWNGDDFFPLSAFSQHEFIAFR